MPPAAAEPGPRDRQWVPAGSAATIGSSSMECTAIPQPPDRRAHKSGIEPLGASASTSRRAAFLQGERDQRMRLAVCADHPRHERMERGRTGKAEPIRPASPRAGAAYCGDRVLDLLQDGRASVKNSPGLGQLDAARVTPEQPRAASSAFERAYLLAQRRLLNAEAFGGAGDVALPRPPPQSIADAAIPYVINIKNVVAIY